MLGKYVRVQQHLFAADCNFSVQFHCFAHELNLMLEHSVKNITAIKSIFETIGDIYRFMEDSLTRKNINRKHLNEKELLLGRPLFTHSPKQNETTVCRVYCAKFLQISGLSGFIMIRLPYLELANCR